MMNRCCALLVLFAVWTTCGQLEPAKSQADEPALTVQPPSAVLDMNGWKLTLPYNTKRKGNPDEVTQPEIMTFNEPSCFFVSDAGDAVIFRAACGGPGTERSTYPRSELREMRADGKDEIAWATDDGRRHVLVIEQAITHLPEVKQHVVCAQIHDNEDDVLMVRLEKQKLFIERNELPDVRLDSDYQLGDRFKLRLATGDGRVRAWYNDELKMDWEVSRPRCYFKAGCYTQSNVGKGDRPEAYGEVAIYKLNVTHSESVAFANSPTGQEANWPQAAGPNGNWQVSGQAATHWSVVRDENIRWRTPLPEAGMSAVTVWGDRVFTTTHVPIESEEEKNGVKDIVGFCLDADTGKMLWQVTLPGSSLISLAGGFTDGTVFAPLCDGQHVWFFNRCGSMGCYDLDGKQVWRREWTPRFKHNNRQCEPMLAGDTILYVEVANKQAGAKMQKWAAPGVRAKSIKVPSGVEPKEVWTYIHGIDKKTGEVLWHEKAGTSIHNTPVIGRTADGGLAVAHARGGGHGPLEKPYGHSLTSLAPGREGETLWSTELAGYDPPFSCHWSEKYTFGFHQGNHVVMDTMTGEILRRQPLYENANIWKRDLAADDWKLEEGVAVKAGKGHPNTNQANLVVGDWHWFLSHNLPYLGRVHVETGRVEYLELPAQLIANRERRQRDEWLWRRGKQDNRPLNARGFAVGDKGHNGSGWGHISAASPILVGRYLYWPVVTGTTYVIDTAVPQLGGDALVAINDLGPGGKTWTLSSMSYARGRLYMHTMREVLCIEDAKP